MKKYIDTAKEVMLTEAQGIVQAVEYITEEQFHSVIEILLGCKGKIVLTGIGKSGIIARKIAATLSSIGNSSFFMHAADASHGDLGVVTDTDVLMIISNSGESGEILELITSVIKITCKIIVLTSNPNAAILRYADAFIIFPRLKEADSINVVPSVSSTVVLALGDAIAITLMKEKNFTQEDFSQNHPNGSLGKKLTIRVEDVMCRGAEIPLVQYDTSVKDAIFEISSKGFGATLIINDNIELLGIITDGDIRRGLQKEKLTWSTKVKDLMTIKPTVINQNSYLKEALDVMRGKKIMFLPVVNDENNIVGVIHMHSILNYGIF